MISQNVPAGFAEFPKKFIIPVLCVFLFLFFRKLVKAEQVMWAQALEEMLILVQKSLDEQFYTS